MNLFDLLCFKQVVLSEFDLFLELLNILRNKGFKSKHLFLNLAPNFRFPTGSYSVVYICFKLKLGMKVQNSPLRNIFLYVVYNFKYLDCYFIFTLYTFFWEMSGF